MASKLDILIEVKARAEELHRLVGQMGDLTTKARTATPAANGLSAAIAGFAGGLAAGAVTQFVAVLGAIPSAFANAAREGIRFNAQVETAQLGIAAILRQFNPNDYKTFDAALNASADAIDLLRQKAVESPATFGELVGAFQGVSGAATAANIPIAKQVDLVVLMSQSLAALGIRSDQILQESRALLTGNITEDAMAAKILGITKADIDAAKASGQLFEFLTGKMAGFAEAGKAAQGTLSVALSNIEDGLTNLKATATEPLMEPLTESVLAFNAAASSGAAKGLAQDLGLLLRASLDTSKASADGLVETLLKVPGLLTALRATPGSSQILQGVEYLLNKSVEQRGLELQKQTESLYAQARAAQDAVSQETARVAIVEAISTAQANVASGKIADNAQTQTSIALLERMLVSWQNITAEKAKGASFDVQQNAALDKALIGLAEANKMKVAENNLLEAQKAGRDTTALQEEIDFLKVRNEVQRTYNELLATTPNADEQTKRLAAREADAAGELLRERLRLQRMPNPTTAVDATGVDAPAAAVTGDLPASDLGYLPDPTWETEWADWFARLESMSVQSAQLVQGALQSAVDNVSNAISSAVMGTKSWGAAFAEAGRSMLSQLIQMGVQFVINNTLQALFGNIQKTNAVTGMALRQADAQATVAAETTKAAAATPAALLTSISSYGVAAGIGLAAILAVIASFGGFAEGGYTGSGGKYEPAGVVHRGEYVFTKEQTSRIGAANLERIASMPTGVRAYATGGLVGGGSADSLQPLRGGSAEGGDVRVEAPRVNVAVVQSRAEVQRWAESAEGQSYIGEIVEGRMRTRAL